jgi:hypothetical protein
MILNRLIAIVSAIMLTVSCIPNSWAENTQPTQSGPSGGAVTAAVVSDIIYVPGKAIVCAASGTLWTAAMFLTFGVCYNECGNFVHDVCSGKWVITGNDMVRTKEKF